ncbi:BgTH12-04185 [Blumeria graminis f. sp. triticale]|uniref:BgTH12-04185 n=1 Tax=Blumeria graminis f. sp. triticale TaxID=1689686 RepID=A0A9W4CXA6_BLUGR|nr:BgTH12-04185 [Blumeria graminis f. sp. triticale]
MPFSTYSSSSFM